MVGPPTTHYRLCDITGLEGFDWPLSGDRVSKRPTAVSEGLGLSLSSVYHTH